MTHVELFSDGMPMPMTLARYPNIASADPRLRLMNVIESDPTSHTFTVNDTRGAVWANTNATLMAHDVWVHGFWGFDWADTYLEVVIITAKAGTPGSRTRGRVLPLDTPVYLGAPSVQGYQYLRLFQNNGRQ